MESLADIYKRHCVTGPDVGHGDKGGTHSYIGSYERLLQPYRAKCTLMEMGIAFGLSLEMWREFMPTSRIIGVNNCYVFDTSKLLAAGIELIEADCTTQDFKRKVSGIGFDVVIDDASHMYDNQIATFNLLKNQMNPGGIYIIEDILCPEQAVPGFRKLHPNCEIIDLRHVKKRFDDMLVVFRF